MKTTLACLTLALACFSLPMNAPAQDAAAPFRHAVFFKFKDGTPAAEIAEIEKAFAALKGKIDTIADYEWGTSESVEKLNDGFTHGFIMTFASPEARDEYLPHPEHERVKAIVVPCLARVIVFDLTMPS